MKRSKVRAYQKEDVRYRYLLWLIAGNYRRDLEVQMVMMIEHWIKEKNYSLMMMIVETNKSYSNPSSKDESDDSNLKLRNKIGYSRLPWKQGILRCRRRERRMSHHRLRIDQRLHLQVMTSIYWKKVRSRMDLRLVEAIVKREVVQLSHRIRSRDLHCWRQTWRWWSVSFHMQFVSTYD